MKDFRETIRSMDNVYKSLPQPKTPVLVLGVVVNLLLAVEFLWFSTQRWFAPYYPLTYTLTALALLGALLMIARLIRRNRARALQGPSNRDFSA